LSSRVKIRTQQIFIAFSASVCAGSLISAHPQHGRFARYDQPSSSTHTNSTDAGGGGGGGLTGLEDNDKLVNKTIDLLDFLSQLITNQDHPEQSNNSMSNLTFEDTMSQLDTIIAQLDNDEPPPTLSKDQSSSSSLASRDPEPRFDANDPEAMARYEALVELKQMLDHQFSEYATAAAQDDHQEGGGVGTHPNDPHADNSLRELEDSSSASLFESSSNTMFNDKDRLKIPLVGVPGSDPSNIPLNEDSLNVIVQQGEDGSSPGGVAIYPISEMDQLKSTISDLTGVDFDTLIQEVSASIGEVHSPLRVEEQHTQLTEQPGRQPYYKYTETVADVVPISAKPRDPDVNIISKRYEEGDLISTNNRNYQLMRRRRPSGHQAGDYHQGQISDVTPVRNSNNNFGPTLQDIAEASAAGSSDDVKVNVTTKTNIVNVFTFNIYLNNATENNFTLVRGAPVRSTIQTTANINTKDKDGRPHNSISLYQYNANDNNTPYAGDTDNDKLGSSSNGGELEKWLKVLLNHQAYGDGSNMVAEAVLKDASLQQIPEPRTASLYRSEENGQQSSPLIGPLGLRTDMQGDVIDMGKSSLTKSPPRKEERGLMETLASSPIPTILAGIAAISPYWLSVLGKRKKRHVSSVVDIPEQWLEYLLGTRYTRRTSTVEPTTLLGTRYTTRTSTLKPLFEENTMETSTITKREAAESSTVSDDFMTTSITYEMPEWYNTDLEDSTSPTTKTTVTQSASEATAPSVQISKIRMPSSTNHHKKTSSDHQASSSAAAGEGGIFNLLQHWASLYNTVKDDGGLQKDLIRNRIKLRTTTTTKRPRTRPTTTRTTATTTKV
jgi:hypothetical protein